MEIADKQSGKIVIKQPWLAVFMSTLLTGAGQIYGGKRTRGIFFLLIISLMYLLALISFYYFLFLENAVSSRLSAIFGIISLLSAIILDIYVLFDSHKIARKYNIEHRLVIENAIKRKPWLAVFLSYLLPGIGQFYNKQILKGIALIITTVALYIACTIYYSLFIFLIPLYFFALGDAFNTSEKMNGSTYKFLKQESKIIKIFIIVMIIFSLVPFDDIIKTYVISIKAFTLPSGSMLPTLEVGDHILVDKSAKAKNSIKRGDIVVFKFPQDQTKAFMKRIVGIGGDVVEIQDKVVYINGILLNEPYVIHEDPNIHSELNAFRKKDPRDNFGPVKVPENNIFVMGDNRDQSNDSRYWGFVPRTFIEGKAFKIYWSLDSEIGEIRWARIGMNIR